MKEKPQDQTVKYSANDLYGPLTIKAANHCLDFLEEVERRLEDVVSEDLLGGIELEMRQASHAEKIDDDTKQFLNYLSETLGFYLTEHITDAITSFVKKWKGDLPNTVIREFNNTSDTDVQFWRHTA